MKPPIERIAWIGVVTAMAAWNLAQKNPGIGSATGKESADQQPSQASSAAQNYSPRRDRSTARATTGSASLKARAGSALRSGDPLIRMAELLKTLETCSAADIDQVRAAFTEMKASGISLPAEEDLLNFRAGQLKGAELLADQTNPPQDPATLAAQRKQFSGWAQTSPRQAAGWLDRLPPGKYHDLMTMDYIATSSKEDPAGSLQWVSSLHPSQQSNAGREVGKRLAESSSTDETSALLSTLESASTPENSRYLQGLFDGLVGDTLAGDAQMALVERHLDQPYVNSSLLARVSQQKAKSDPVEALQWAAGVERHKQGINPGEVEEAAVQAMSLAGLEKAGRWAANSGNEELRTLINLQRSRVENHGDDSNEYDKDD